MNESSYHGKNLYAVFGRPIQHSLSPQIHTAFAKAENISLNYERISCTDADFAKTVAQFAERGGQGFNVTTPFKTLAYDLCENLTPQARELGVVNTVRIHRPHHYEGHNTDGQGFVRDIFTYRKFCTGETKILLLGAGATARAIISAVRQMALGQLHVYNRNPDRLAKFIETWSAAPVVMPPEPCPTHGEQTYDLIVNAIAMLDKSADIILPKLGRQSESCLAYDLNYGHGQTAFTHWARKLDCTVCDGIGMLIEQAALSFQWWHGGKLPETQQVRKCYNAPFFSG